MKTKSIIAILLIFASTATFASKPGKSKVSTSTKVVTVEGNYSKISVGSNLNVVFLTDVNAQTRVEGNNSLVNGVDFKVVNGTLFISSKNSFSSQGTIYLPAKNLSEIYLNANSKISSNGFLNCTDLTIYVSDGSMAAIKNKGQLELKPTSGTELNFEKYATIRE